MEGYGVTMGILLMLLTYISIAVFLWRIFWRILILLKRNRAMVQDPVRASGARAALRTAFDLLFLGRLMRVNDVLWLGEWVFHMSFLLVILSHLRFLLEPVPGFVAWLQGLGKVSGFLLPASIAYILFMKLTSERARYLSGQNFFLLLLVFVISMSGHMLRYVYKADLVSIKGFVLGILTFSPNPLPESNVFVIHLLTVLVLLVYLPTHIFTAPFVVAEAGKREAGLDSVMHEK